MVHELNEGHSICNQEELYIVTVSFRYFLWNIALNYITNESYTDIIHLETKTQLQINHWPRITVIACCVTWTAARAGGQYDDVTIKYYR